jgi:hypothetical protein
MDQIVGDDSRPNHVPAVTLLVGDDTHAQRQPVLFLSLFNY